MIIVARGPGYLGRPYNDTQLRFLALEIFLVVTSTLSVILRLISRKLSKQNFWYDDYLIILSLLFCFVSLGAEVYTLKDGLGVPDADARIREFLKEVLLELSLYIITLVAVKISILLMYYRIFKVAPGFKLAVWVTAGLVCVWGTVNFLMTLFECRPIQYFWNVGSGVCLDRQVLYTVNAAVNCVLDLLILGLPVRLIWNLQLTTTKRVLLFVTFGLGAGVCIVSIIRLEVIVTQPIIGSNISMSSIPTFVWTNVELHVSIICACLPTYRPFLTSVTACIFPKSRLFGSRPGGYQSRQSAISSYPAQEKSPTNNSLQGRTPVQGQYSVSELDTTNSIPWTSFSNVDDDRPTPVISRDMSDLDVARPKSFRSVSAAMQEKYTGSKSILPSLPGRASTQELVDPTNLDFTDSRMDRPQPLRRLSTTVPERSAKSNFRTEKPVRTPYNIIDSATADKDPRRNSQDLESPRPRIARRTTVAAQGRSARRDPNARAPPQASSSIDKTIISEPDPLRSFQKVGAVPQMPPRIVNVGAQGNSARRGLHAQAPLRTPLNINNSATSDPAPVRSLPDLEAGRPEIIQSLTASHMKKGLQKAVESNPRPGIDPVQHTNLVPNQGTATLGLEEELPNIIHPDTRQNAPTPQARFPRPVRRVNSPSGGRKLSDVLEHSITSPSALATTHSDPRSSSPNVQVQRPRPVKDMSVPDLELGLPEDILEGGLHRFSWTNSSWFMDD